MDADTFQQLLDLKAGYFHNLDLKRWTDVAAVFTGDARFEGYAFPVDGGTDAFVSVLSDFLGDVRSEHMGHTPRFRSVSDGIVRGVWRMTDYLTWEADTKVYKGIAVPGMFGLRGWGLYEEEYSHTPEGWRISFSRLTRTRIDALTTAGTVTPDYDVLRPNPDWLDGGAR